MLSTVDPPQLTSVVLTSLGNDMFELFLQYDQQVCESVVCGTMSQLIVIFLILNSICLCRSHSLLPAVSSMSFKMMED